MGPVALHEGERGEIVEGGGEVGVVRPERLLVYGKAALIERLGLGVAALAVVELGEVVEGGGEAGVVRPERLLVYAKAALIERLGLGLAALGLVNVSQPRNCGSVFRVVVAMLPASQGNVPLGYRDGFGILASVVKLADLSTERSEVVSTLRSRPRRPSDCNEGHECQQCARTPCPPYHHWS